MFYTEFVTLLHNDREEGNLVLGVPQWYIMRFIASNLNHVNMRCYALCAGREERERKRKREGGREYLMCSERGYIFGTASTSSPYKTVFIHTMYSYDV